MPKINNVHTPNQITFQFDIVENESLIYSKENEDYSNWIPCDVKLFVENMIYDFQYIPILSLEGLKNFIKNFDELMMESNHNKLENSGINYNFEYYSSDGEFIISFRNVEDEEDESIVETIIWINMAACTGSSDGYFTGFRFWVSLRELEQFFKETKVQLYDITNE